MWERKQFIIWKKRQNANGKTDKIPCDYRTGAAADAHNPANWTDYATAAGVAAAFGPEYGAGVVLNADPAVTQLPGLFCLDFDGHYDPVTGQASAYVMRALELMPSLAWEVSVSGNGIHLFGYASRIDPHRCKNSRVKIEMYHDKRFIAFGGNSLAGAPYAADSSEGLAQFASELFPNDPGAAGGSGNPSQCLTFDDLARFQPPEDYTGPTNDDDLIRAASASRDSAAVAFGTSESFLDLWSRASGEADDASSRDAALVSRLAFWTGKDGQRIHRLMLRSALAREKWEREDYLPRTIGEILSRPCTYYNKPKSISPFANVVSEATGFDIVDRTESTFISVEDQKTVFKGCVYVVDENGILCPDGAILDKSRFDIVYGGMTFQHKRSTDGGKQTTDSAWQAFTQSQVLRFPRASAVCFRPREPYGAVIQGMVNIYRPIDTACYPGDITPFLTWFERFLPHERDRTILLSYLAAMVQHKGYKFQYWPVIQGAKGNGKTFLSRLMVHCIGHKYSHLPNTGELARSGMKFNSWVFGHLFLSFEEVQFAHRREFLEEMKAIVTNESIPIEFKGRDQRTLDNYANGMIFTNHRNGCPVDDEERRYSVFFTAQQTRADINRDFPPGFFSAFYDWANSGGYAHLHHFLKHWPIPNEFNPARVERAPVTSSQTQAVVASRGPIEQEIFEQVESGTVGFRGGYVSLTMLRKYLQSIGMRPGLKTVTDSLERLGYVEHPSLPNGRANRVVLPDNSRSVLYIRADDFALLEMNAVKAQDDYEAMQK